MDNQAALGEKEAIGLCFEGGVNHLLLQLGTQLRQLVHILPVVGALRHAEWEVEFELREDFPVEEVFLDQRQVL